MDLVGNKATVVEQAKNMEGMFWYTIINKHNNNPEIKMDMNWLGDVHVYTVVVSTCTFSMWAELNPYINPKPNPKPYNPNCGIYLPG